MFLLRRLNQALFAAARAGNSSLCKVSVHLRFSSRLSSTPLRVYISALINVHTQALVARGAQIDSQSVDARSQAREMRAKERLCVFDFAWVDLKERGGGRGGLPTHVNTAYTLVSGCFCLSFCLCLPVRVDLACPVSLSLQLFLISPSLPFPPPSLPLRPSRSRSRQVLAGHVLSGHLRPRLLRAGTHGLSGGGYARAERSMEY